MNRKRLFVIILALSAVAVCVALFLFTSSGSSDWTQTLPDGSVLALRRITKGTKHRYVSGNVFQRTADRVLPERWAKRLGAPAVTYNSSNVTHILWLERIAPTNSPRGSGLQTSLFSRITNEAGFDRLYQAAAQLYTPGRQIHGFRLDACPTDSRKIRVTVKQLSFARLPDVSFEVSNPEFVARRKWQARPCPIEAVQDDVSLRLERFATQAQHPPTGIGGPRTDLIFVIQDRAVPANNWFARSVRFFNEAGSEFLSGVYPTDAAGARTYTAFPGGLSSAEPYKLRFELRRTSYGPDEQHVFRAVPVPRTNGTPSEPLHARLQGFTLVVALAPGGAITAQIEPPTNDWRLDPVRVVDDRGRWLHPRGESTYDGRFSGSIPLEPDSATVDLTFALTGLRTIEVIARPSLGQ